jgi:hypothetical protein
MASQNPSNFNATGFNRSIKRNVETKGGKMRAYTNLATGDLYREEGVYPLIAGGGLPTKITNRFPDSPTSESDYSNRRVRRADYNDGQYADRADLDRMVVDPRYEKTDILLQKFRRLEDVTIQAAALGSAQGGDTGETATAFDANNIIDVTLGAAAGVTNAGFTYEKLTETMRTFQNNDVDVTESAYMPCIFIGPDQMKDMLEQDKFINKDYINQSLVANKYFIPNYLGATFIVTNILPYMNTAGTGFRVDPDSDIVTTGKKTKQGRWKDTDSTDIRSCIAMTKDAVLFEVKPDIITRVSERADKSYRWYTYIEMGLGAVRMEEEKVISIPCDQSPV